METLNLINKLIEIFGANATLAEAKSWLEVEENAQSLRDEGHEQPLADVEDGNDETPVDEGNDPEGA
jgi:hypothetical protein